jgi:hypothetical protein
MDGGHPATNVRGVLVRSSLTITGAANGAEGNDVAQSGASVGEGIDVLGDGK